MDPKDENGGYDDFNRVHTEITRESTLRRWKTGKIHIPTTRVTPIRKKKLITFLSYC
jgi:hypothetical protein